MDLGPFTIHKPTVQNDAVAPESRRIVYIDTFGKNFTGHVP